MIEVRVLGGLEVLADGAPVELPADARARELLGWLALHPGAHPRSRLAGLLRPDVPEESARKSLRQAVYELRRSWPAPARDVIVATRDAVGLDPAGVRVDGLDFRSLLDAGSLEEAVALSHGELLGDLDAEWVLEARDEHSVAVARCLATLARQAEEASDPEAAVAWARRRIEVEPMAEAAHRELVRLLALSGDRPAALAAADALAGRLRRELGLAPSAETRALVEEVRRGRLRSAVPSPRAALPPPLARTARPLGRTGALERLEAAWGEGRSAGLRLVSVAGEAGIGKTTLVGEFARRLHERGATVLYGRCDEDPLLPYGPWVEALGRHLEGVAAAEREAWLAVSGGALACLLPGLAPAGGSEGGADERYLAFEAARGVLEQAAAMHGLLLVLDDLHWADAGTLRLLRHLARTSQRTPVLLVACVRDGELGPAAAAALVDLRREGLLEDLPLSGLDDDSVGALLAAHTGSTDADLARSLRARTGGNPFFVDELLQDHRERGGSGPPAGVRDVVGRRLARLEPEAAEALSLAAVVGLEWEVATVAEALGRPAGDVLEALDGAAATGLVVEAGSPGRYGFAHALVGETVLAGLPAPRRTRLSLRVADALEGRHAAADGDARAGEVARHLRAAGPLAAPERRARWERAAGAEATAALAHEQAAEHYEAALAALEETGAGLDDDRSRLLLELAGAYERAGHRRRAREAFAAVAAVARERRDQALLARAALGHGGLGVSVTAAEPQVVALLDEALAGLDGGDRATRARLRARLAVELYYSNRDRARELSAAAVDDARATGDAATLAAALNARRVVIWDPLHSDERLAVATEMVALGEAAGDRSAALQGHNWRVVDLLELGRVGEAAAEVDVYAQRADAIGLPHYRWFVPLWRACLALLTGRWEEARALGARARALGAAADDPNAALLVRIQDEYEREAQRRVGELDRDWVVEMAASTPAPGAWEVWLAEIDVMRGDAAAGRRLVDDLTRDGCRRLPVDVNWHAFCDLTEAIADLRERDAALAVYEKLAPHAHLFPVVARAVACYGSAEYYVGRLAATLGRWDEAEARLRRAVDENERVGAAPRAALAVLRLGEVRAARGDVGGGRDLLAEAAGRARALGVPALAAEAERALGALVGAARD